MDSSGDKSERVDRIIGGSSALRSGRLWPRPQSRQRSAETSSVSAFPLFCLTQRGAGSPPQQSVWAVSCLIVPPSKKYSTKQGAPKQRQTLSIHRRRSASSGANVPCFADLAPQRNGRGSLGTPANGDTQGACPWAALCLLSRRRESRSLRRAKHLPKKQHPPLPKSKKTPPIRAAF